MRSFNGTSLFLTHGQALELLPVGLLLASLPLLPLRRCGAPG